MKPAPFEYVAPSTLDEALQLLQAHAAEAKLLAGGQSLVPVMNFRLAQPSFIIDLNRLPELAYITPTGDGVRIGAMTRQSALEHSAAVARHAPLLHAAVPYIAHPQIRNRGTIGGSLAHADPAGELPVVTVALNARFRLTRAAGSRWVDSADFYIGLFTTALAEDEILTEVHLPALPPRTGWAFQELARRHGDYAQAGVAALLTLDERGVCTAARLVFLNVGDIPMVAAEAAQLLVGQRVTPEAIAAAAQHAAQHEIEPAGDVHGSAEYKRHLSAVLARRTLQQALERVSA